ncbi:MAG: helix-turn-helix domain-containing protein [Firmicutes bacterium]|nr:helix-turn-helix domain-containing protein [Bacillota bacterium]
MGQINYLSVSQVAEELQVSYQKVLYMIRTGKLPAEKEGKAFKIPANYREVLVEVRPRKKMASKKSAAKGKQGRAKQEVVVGKDALVNNLAKAIQELVKFQVEKALGNKKVRI